MTGKRRAGKDPVPPAPRPPARTGEPAAPPLVISPRLTRREERQRRKRDQRKRFGFAGGGVALVIGAIVVATLVIGGVKVATDSGGHNRTQSTVLLQIQGPNRTAVGSVLLANDPGPPPAAAVVLVPSLLITDVCGFGSQTFGNILALPNGVTNSRTALSAVLHGVTIDGSWVLTTSQLTKLVDGVGGVNVDVDTDVVQHTGGGGGRVLVQSGNQHLNGTQAVEYLSYQPASDQTAAAQLLRMQRVVDATLQALRPRGKTAIQALLRSLGPGGTSTVGSGTLADIVTGVAAAENNNAAQVNETDLPATPLDVGGAIPSYRPDDSATGITALVRSSLSASVPANANSQHATVYLLNGTGQVGLVGTACSKLADHGFTYAGADNASSFSNARSEVQVFSTGAVSQGDQLAKALGLPTSDVRRGTFNQNVAKFVVVLGGDYKP